MGQPLTNLTFHEWVQHIFAHPVTDPTWHWDYDRDWWDGPAATTVSYLTRCFENADTVLRVFSAAQVYQGLNLLVSSSCSNDMYSVLDESVPLEDRLRAIHSFYQL